MTNSKPAGKNIPLKWVVPPDVPATYANNVTVQHTKAEFFITFYQAKPPMGLSAEEILALDELEVHAVAQIVVPAANMPGFVEALTENLKRHSSVPWDEAAEEG